MEGVSQEVLHEQYSSHMYHCGHNHVSHRVTCKWIPYWVALGR